MTVYVAATTADGDQSKFIAGPFADIHEAAASGATGYLFQVTGDSAPVMLPTCLGNPADFAKKSYAVSAAESSVLAPDSE